MVDILEGQYFIKRRLGKYTRPWGVYQRLVGRDVRITAFKTELHARMYAAAQSIAMEQS